MLLRFGVSNHRSIRDFQELSFSASSLKDPDNGLIACAAVPSGAVVPAVAIYGANASGKSSFIDALATMRHLVLRSQIEFEPNAPILPLRHFALDPACAEAPARFEIDFMVDGVRYRYGFEASYTEFKSEWLHAFPKSYRRMLFERDGDEFHFGRGLKGENSVISRLTRRNSLYLSAAAQNGHAQLSPLFGYFESIRICGAGLHGYSALSIPLEPDGRIMRFLEDIGTGVIDYRQIEIHFSSNQERRGLWIVDPKENHDRKSLGIPKDAHKHIEIELAHRGQNGKHQYFPLDWESAGTRRLLEILDLAFCALDDGYPLIIDEIGANLHTRAAEAVLNLFCSPAINPKGAQVVATTHDTNLLNAPALRRDQVWFAEKDPEGATRLYPLTDIRTRKGDNVERGYLQGRYGATPGDMDISTLVPRR